MKKISLAVLLLTCVAATAWPQEQPPQLLIHAAHCLAVKDQLPSSKAPTLSFGYFLDEKSYPGDQVLYVVNYASPTRANGLAFAVFLSGDDGGQVFNIQNNASFVLSKGDIHSISFVRDPLGGEWTQERLASAIERIEKQPRFSILVKDLYATDSSVRCESYTDPQPKRGEK